MKKLLFILINVLITCYGFSQVYSLPDNTYGKQFRRGKFDSTLHIPTISGSPVGKGSLVDKVYQNQSAIVFDSTNKAFWVYSPTDSVWVKALSPTSLSNGTDINYNSSTGVINNISTLNSVVGRGSVITGTNLVRFYNTSGNNGIQFYNNPNNNGYGLGFSNSSDSSFTLNYDGALGITKQNIFKFLKDGTALFYGNLTANSLIKSGGTSTQFLKADGSVDGNTYLTGNQTITVSGDASGSGTTSIPLTLANTTVTGGSYGNSTNVGTFTVDSKGRLTAASNTAIAFPVTSVAGRTGAVVIDTSDISNFYTKVRGLFSAGTGLSFSNGTFTNTGVTSISGTANQVIASSSIGSVTLSLPQSIGTTSNVTFNQVNASSDISTQTQFNAGNTGYVAQLLGGSSNNAVLVNVNNDATKWSIGSNVGFQNVTNNRNLNFNYTNAVTTKNLMNLDTIGNLNITGNVTANSLIKSGGTSSQFLKADGSVDANTYLTSTTGVTSITGTANQVIASASTGAVTLSLPQSIATTNNVTFNQVNGSSDISTQTQFNAGSTGYISQLLGGSSNNAVLVNVNNDNTKWAIGSDIGLNPVSSNRKLNFKYNNGTSWIGYLSIDTSGEATFSSSVTASSLIKSGGTSSQFLKADGSVDGTAYLPLTGGTLSGTLNGTSVLLNNTINIPASGINNILSIANVTDIGTALNAGSAISANASELDYTSSASRNIGVSNILSGGLFVNRPNISGSSTITISQGSFGKRALSGLTGVVSIPSTAAATSTITDVASLRAFLYADNTSNLYTITNYYGLLLGNSSEYMPTNITNRYGIYQDGTNDTNLLNGATIFNNTIKLKGYTVSTLPAGQTGMVAYVTDAVSPTYNGSLTGGGTVTVPVFFNGTSWVSH